MGLSFLGATVGPLSETLDGFAHANHGAVSGNVFRNAFANTPQWARRSACELRFLKVSFRMNLSIMGASLANESSSRRPVQSGQSVRTTMDLFRKMFPTNSRMVLIRPSISSLNGPTVGALNAESPQKNFFTKIENKNIWSRNRCFSYGFPPYSACAKL